jgi:type II secretory pathway component GspD/PulD (secretin)
VINPEVVRKQFFRIFCDQPIAFNVFLCLAILFLMLPIASSAGNTPNAGNELISLTAKDEPLGDVLKKISMATGYEIILDNNWRSYPVTVSLEKVTLHKGLKRILKNFNNVIVYVSSKKINIIIYDKISPEGGSPASSPDGSFGRTPVNQRRSYRPPAPGVPDSQALETEEASPDNPAVSGEESDTGTSDSDEGPHTDSEDKSPEDGSERKNQSESSPGEEPKSSEGAESAGKNE